MSTSDPFETTGSTADVSADDLLRELCGDEPGEAIVGQEASEHFEVSETGETSVSETEEGSGEEMDAVPQHLLENFDDYLAAHNGEFFIFHLDVSPDESRNPRPETIKRERQDINLKELVTGNADKIKVTLRSGVLFEDQLDELRELEQNGKVRDTVLKEIDRALGSMDGAFDKWVKEGTTNPWKGRIVSFAWSFVSEDQVHAMLAKNEDEEREILATFWALMSVGVRAAYTVADHEDRWIISRSLILGVHSVTGVQLDTGRYSKQSVDIRSKLFPNSMDALGIAEVASLLGIPVPPDAAVGADVFGIVEAQDWEQLTRFSQATVAVEKEVFRLMKRYVKV